MSDVTAAESTRRWLALTLGVLRGVTRTIGGAPFSTMSWVDVPAWRESLDTLRKNEYVSPPAALPPPRRRVAKETSFFITAGVTPAGP